MNRLIQVGLLFISLMVGIQGQTPISCKINLDKTIVPRHGFFNEQEVWDGWYTVTVDSQLFSNCDILKRGICRYVSSQDYGCDNSWYSWDTSVGGLYKKRFSNGLICARGESQYHGNLEPGMRLIRDFLEERGQGYDFYEWSQEIPCFKRNPKDNSPLIIAIVISTIAGTGIFFITLRAGLELAKLHEHPLCLVLGWFLGCHFCNNCCCLYDPEWKKSFSTLESQKKKFKKRMLSHASFRPSARQKQAPWQILEDLSNQFDWERTNRPLLRSERWVFTQLGLSSGQWNYNDPADCNEITGRLRAINQLDIVEKLSSDFKKKNFWIQAEEEVEAKIKTWLDIEEELWEIEGQLLIQQEKEMVKKKENKICCWVYCLPPILCFSRDARQVCGKRCCGRSSDSATSSSMAPVMVPSMAPAMVPPMTPVIVPSIAPAMAPSLDPSVEKDEAC